MDITGQIIQKIINQQQVIIGPLAFDQARKVAGLKISPTGDIKVEGNSKEVLGSLVQQYEHLFGKASVEVCKDALKEITPPLSPDDLPDILK